MIHFERNRSCIKSAVWYKSRRTDFVVRAV